MKPKLSGSITLPSQSDVEMRLLHFLYKYNRAVKPKELYGPLADDLGLSQEQRGARRASSGELAWNNLVRYAKWRLLERGLIDQNSPRGFWRLTARGREEAAKWEQILSAPLTDLL